MSDVVIVAIITLIGTIGSALIGVITAHSLTKFQITELTREVRKHNNFAERIPVMEEQIRVVNHRIDDLENYHKPN